MDILLWILAALGLVGGVILAFDEGVVWLAAGLVSFAVLGGFASVLRLLNEMSSKLSDIRDRLPQPPDEEPETPPEELPVTAEDEAMLAAAAEEARLAKFRMPGERVVFGRYPQGKKGAEAGISWIVLDAVGDQSLLISESALDAKQFHEEEENIKTCWEDCSLRGWLNQAFCEAAFSEQERSALCEESHEEAKTGDKVFLLSQAETSRYFARRAERSCHVTPYAEKQGAYCGKEGKGWWWLRSVSGDLYRRSEKVMCVDASGQFTSIDADNCDCSVRPAIWVNTSLI